MSVEKFIQRIEPENIRQLTLEARNFIQAFLPGIQITIKWQVPYFSYLGLLCYLNPHADRLSIGFAKGHLMSDMQGILRGEGELKIVRYLDIYPKDGLPKTTLAELLSEAAMINELEQSTRKKR